MRERPILFSSPMVRALLEGRKTQTRRIVKHEHIDCVDVFAFDEQRGEWEMGEVHQGPTAHVGWLKCPYGIPGDRLWVRETSVIAPPCWGDSVTSDFVLDCNGEQRLVQYLATSPDRSAANDYGLKATPSIFMPRWASRITLEIVSVRVERLHEISEEDAMAEGIERVHGDLFGVGGLIPLEHHYAPDAFRALWGSIHGEGSWTANPWLWVLELRRVTP